MTPSSRSYRHLFWVLGLIGLTADLASKHAMFAWKAPGEEYEIISGIFSLIHNDRLNQGALFGIGDNHGSTSNRLFAAVSGVAVVFIIGWSMKSSTARDRLLCMALGLVLGGALGNLYDRVVFGGVRDFIWVRYGRFDWPVFNVADSCLVCGAGLLLLQAFFTPQADPSASAQQPASAAR